MAEGTATNTLEWTEDFVYGQGRALARVASGGTDYLLHDHLGSTRLVVDAATHEYELQSFYPFGEEVSAPGPDDVALKFTGHERDEEGPASRALDYMRARYCSPELGRFLTVDPVRSERLPSPQTWNRYTYARNNPTRFIDPDGQESSTAIRLEHNLQRVLDGDLSTEGFWETQRNPPAMAGAVAVTLLSPGPEDAVIAAVVAKSGGKVLGRVGSFFRKLFRNGDDVVDAGSAAVRIPDKATATLDHVQQTGRAPDGYNGGRRFQNREGKLPEGGNFKEYDVDPKPAAAGGRRNAERIVVDQDSGRAWYTNDHYETFVEIE